MKLLERMKGLFAGEGQPPASGMERQIADWARLYRQGSLTGRSKLRLPSAIASELARLAVCELDSSVVGEARGAYLDRQYQRVRKQLRVWAEYGFACGGMVLKVIPRGGELPVECITAENFVPLEQDSTGRVTAAEFWEERWLEGRRYRRMERHRLEGSRYTITNRVLDRWGNEVPLGTLPCWAELAAQATLEGIHRPLFVCFRTPMANCMEPDSPLGVSVYAAASQLIEQAEQQWERIEWEYKGSELAVDASEDLFEHRRDGSVVLPQGQERLFRAHDLDIGQSGGKFLEVFSPEIRDRALFCGLDSILRRIEFNCGLAYGTISDPQQVERTAQEVRAGRQRSYAMVCDLQGALEAALRELCEVLDIWATVYELCPDEPWQLRVCWGDSVLVDSETLRESHRKDVAAGLMSVQEYRAVWYGGAAMQEKGREQENA
ncbi:MAG: phage portal protein [Angelakisella sp.]